MYRNSNSWMKHLDFIILDLVVTVAAYIISYRLHLGVKWINRRELYNSGTVIAALGALLCGSRDGDDLHFPDHLEEARPHAPSAR